MSGELEIYKDNVLFKYVFIGAICHSSNLNKRDMGIRGGHYWTIYKTQGDIYYEYNDTKIHKNTYFGELIKRRLETHAYITLWKKTIQP